MQFTQCDNTFDGYFEKNTYRNNGNLAVSLMSWEDNGGDGYWTPHATISTNTNVKLPPDEFVAKNYSENEGLPEQFVAMGYFEDTGRKVQCGFCECPVYRLTAKFDAEVGRVPELQCI